MYNQSVKYVSYSLYGEDTMYSLGLLRNIKSISQLLPDYQVISYVAKNFSPEYLKELSNLGAIAVLQESDWPTNGMFWRFLAIHLPDADRVLFRDCDSDISDREVAAIREWEDSGMAFHIMRDHPLHTAPILGGMWGAIPSEISKYFTKNLFFNFSVEKGQDQEFLALIYPAVRSKSLVHDSFFHVEKNARKFKMPRVHGEYIGEPLDATGAPISLASREYASKVEGSKFLKFLFGLHFRFTISKTLRAKSGVLNG